jgi:hypothetical protein
MKTLERHPIKKPLKHASQEFETAGLVSLDRIFTPG